MIEFRSARSEIIGRKKEERKKNRRKKHKSADKYVGRPNKTYIDLTMPVNNKWVCSLRRYIAVKSYREAARRDEETIALHWVQLYLTREQFCWKLLSARATECIDE